MAEIVMVDAQNPVRERYELRVAKADRNFFIPVGHLKRSVISAAAAKRGPHAPKGLQLRRPIIDLFGYLKRPRKCVLHTVGVVYRITNRVPPSDPGFC